MMVCNMYRCMYIISSSLCYPLVVEIFHDLEKRKTWDHLFHEIEVIEEHKNFRVVYWYLIFLTLILSCVEINLLCM